MLDQQMYRARMVSSVAAVAISLACGTNYIYSAWAPQFADRLHLTTTESNWIGLAGNIGMYAMGVPIGLSIDSCGPRPFALLGAVLLLIGYWPFRAAYENATGSVPVLCFFALLTGMGGCFAFNAAVKTSALNWPHHRGTATAFPLAAFGLSAFFFAVFGGVFFPGDTSAFLTLLTVGTFILPCIGFFFLHVYPQKGQYHAVPGGPGSGHGSDSQLLRRPSTSDDGRKGASPRRGRSFPGAEAGMSPNTHTTPTKTSSTQAVMVGAEAEAWSESGAAGSAGPSTSRNTDASTGYHTDVEAAHRSPPPSHAVEDPQDSDETSSLMSRASSLPGEVLVQNSVDLDQSHRLDIRGLKLLRNTDFWLLFSIMGILAGIGLMTINNIGHVANALGKYWDPTIEDSILVQQQQMHVSILSLGSFAGRLLSGIGSDFLVKKLGASRAWCLVIAACVFSVAQMFALYILNPGLLWLVSGLSGIGYGFLFGVFPSIVAESFGIHALSQNWGWMTLSPAISGNIFNLFYGAVYDSHSVVDGNGEHSCPVGRDCYRKAYMVTFAACGLGLLVALFTIRHQFVKRREENKAIAED